MKWLKTTLDHPNHSTATYRCINNERVSLIKIFLKTLCTVTLALEDLKIKKWNSNTSNHLVLFGDKIRFSYLECCFGSFCDLLLTKLMVTGFFPLLVNVSFLLHLLGWRVWEKRLLAWVKTQCDEHAWQLRRDLILSWYFVLWWLTYM